MPAISIFCRKVVFVQHWWELSAKMPWAALLWHLFLCFRHRLHYLLHLRHFYRLYQYFLRIYHCRHPDRRTSLTSYTFQIFIGLSYLFISVELCFWPRCKLLRCTADSTKYGRISYFSSKVRWLEVSQTIECLVLCGSDLLSGGWSSPVYWNDRIISWSMLHFDSWCFRDCS